MINGISSDYLDSTAFQHICSFYFVFVRESIECTLQTDCFWVIWLIYYYYYFLCHCLNTRNIDRNYCRSWRWNPSLFGRFSSSWKCTALCCTESFWSKCHQRNKPQLEFLLSSSTELIEYIIWLRIMTHYLFIRGIDPPLSHWLFTIDGICC